MMKQTIKQGPCSLIGGDNVVENHKGGMNFVIDGISGTAGLAIPYETAANKMFKTILLGR